MHRQIRCSHTDTEKILVSYLVATTARQFILARKLNVSEAFVTTGHTFALIKEQKCIESKLLNACKPVVMVSREFNLTDTFPGKYGQENILHSINSQQLATLQREIKFISSLRKKKISLNLHEEIDFTVYRQLKFVRMYQKMRAENPSLQQCRNDSLATPTY